MPQIEARLIACDNQTKVLRISCFDDRLYGVEKKNAQSLVVLKNQYLTSNRS